jgi:hypothetical protein
MGRGPPVRRKKAHVPKAIAFKTKPQIALEPIRAACAAGIVRGVVLTDASYGSDSAPRTGIGVLAHCADQGRCSTRRKDAADRMARGRS